VISLSGLSQPVKLCRRFWPLLRLRRAPVPSVRTQHYPRRIQLSAGLLNCANLLQFVWQGRMKLMLSIGVEL